MTFKTLQPLLACALIASLSACSTVRPKPVKPPVKTEERLMTPSPAVVAAKPEEAKASALADILAETPVTGSASLGNAVGQSPVVADASTLAKSPVDAGKATDGASSASLSVRVFYFGTNMSDIGDVAFAALATHAKYLTSNPTARLQIAGHTDERGTREYNLALGERRANAVARYLVGAGVNPSQLSVVSYGKEKPAIEGSNEDAWAKCRRVEVDYLSTGK